MKIVYEPEIEEHSPELYEADLSAVYHNGWDAIDKTALNQYESEGYLVIRNGFNSDDVESARMELLKMTQADNPKCESIYYEGGIRKLLGNSLKGKDNQGDEKNLDELALGSQSEKLPDLDPKIRARYVRKFMGFTTHHFPLMHISNHPSLFALLRKLCQTNQVELFQEMAMIKPPGGREKPWHQDHAYFNHPIETRIIGVWIALSKVTPENGCMYLLPGVNNQGPIPHFIRRDWQICDDEILEVLGHRRISVPMEAGDVLLFDSKLPHGTPKNNSDCSRWALQLHYRSISSSSCTDDTRLAAFGSEGKNVSC